MPYRRLNNFGLGRLHKVTENFINACQKVADRRLGGIFCHGITAAKGN